MLAAGIVPAIRCDVEPRKTNPLIRFQPAQDAMPYGSLFRIHSSNTPTMSRELFRIGQLAPGLHLAVTGESLRAAMSEEWLTRTLAEHPPQAWRYIESDASELPVYLYWEGLCVEAPRKPRAWVIELLARLEQSRDGHDEAPDK